MVDTTIGHYHIPAGRIVMANNWALTHNTKWWTGTDPHTFSPERWLTVEEENRVYSGVESCKFIPYSIGKRVCPGSRLAQAELSIITTGLLCSVSWNRVVESSEIDLREDYSLTLSPTKSQSLCFHRLLETTTYTKKQTNQKKR